MSLGNANTNNNEIINTMRKWQATALAGRIREREMSGKDYIEHAGYQESKINPMKTLKEDYTDKKEIWDKTNKLLLLVPLIGWAVMYSRYKDQKDAEKAWGDKVNEERGKDEAFVENFQQKFDKMTPAERNQICQIGEQFMSKNGFDMQKFVEDNKNLSANDQVLQLEKQVKEMSSQIATYQQNMSVSANKPAQTAQVGQKVDVGKLKEIRGEERKDLSGVDDNSISVAFNEHIKKGEVLVNQHQLRFLNIQENSIHTLKADPNIRFKIKEKTNDGAVIARL